MSPVFEATGKPHSAAGMNLDVNLDVNLDAFVRHVLGIEARSRLYLRFDSSGTKNRDFKGKTYFTGFTGRLSISRDWPKNNRFHGPVTPLLNLMLLIVSVCQPGMYIVGDQCPDCAAGTYSDTIRATRCTSCAVNQYSVLGARECLACPNGKTSPANSSLAGCIIGKWIAN